MRMFNLIASSNTQKLKRTSGERKEVGKNKISLFSQIYKTLIICSKKIFNLPRRVPFFFIL